MKFKTGIIVGFVVGVVVGARLGKERYDRLVARLKSAMQSERVQQTTDVAERTTRKPRAAAGRGLVAAAETIRTKTAAG